MTLFALFLHLQVLVSYLLMDAGTELGLLLAEGAISMLVQPVMRVAGVPERIEPGLRQLQTSFYTRLKSKYTRIFVTSRQGIQIFCNHLLTLSIPLESSLTLSKQGLT